jgi:hypothetical protein
MVCFQWMLLICEKIVFFVFFSTNACVHVSFGHLSDHVCFFFQCLLYTIPTYACFFSVYSCVCFICQRLLYTIPTYSCFFSVYSCVCFFCQRLLYTLPTYACFFSVYSMFVTNVKKDGENSIKLDWKWAQKH